MDSVNLVLVQSQWALYSMTWYQIRGPLPFAFNCKVVHRSFPLKICCKQNNTIYVYVLFKSFKFTILPFSLPHVH